MRRSDDTAEVRSTRPDWLGWFCLAWFVAFGLLYAKMILESRVPELLAAMRRAVLGDSFP